MTNRQTMTDHVEINKAFRLFYKNVYNSDLTNVELHETSKIEEHPLTKKLTK